MSSYQAAPQLVEEQVAKIYELLKELSQIEDYPAIQSNSKKALASVWQMVNHLELEFEQLYHLDV